MNRNGVSDNFTVTQVFGRTLVIAPHADDEVLGAGGTIARLSQSGLDVDVVIVTKGRPPLFSDEANTPIREEAKRAHAHLGVRRTHWLDLPAAQLTETPNHEINKAILAIVREFDPQTLLIPFIGDIHVDHQRLFTSALVAARPYQQRYPRNVLAYETLSETNWNAPYLTPAFVPNVFVDISETLNRKIEAFRLYASQAKLTPHERSPEALEALARLRGATMHRSAAEAFVLIRQII
jgi:LmbE family N-acetylglucosaminyl deacetylase